jgi:hypothetical protein
MIKPIARISRVTVTRMKMTAAGRDFIRTEHERNVVAGVVSTAENGSVREHHGWIGFSEDDVAIA